MAHIKDAKSTTVTNTNDNTNDNDNTTNHTNNHKAHNATQDGRYGRHGPNDVTRRLGLGVFFFLIQVYSSTNISLYK